jgi:hypothetical protein
MRRRVRRERVGLRREEDGLTDVLGLETFNRFESFVVGSEFDSESFRMARIAGNGEDDTEIPGMAACSDSALADFSLRRSIAIRLDSLRLCPSTPSRVYIVLSWPPFVLQDREAMRWMRRKRWMTKGIQVLGEFGRSMILGERGMIRMMTVES